MVTLYGLSLPILSPGRGKEGWGCPPPHGVIAPTWAGSVWLPHAKASVRRCFLMFQHLLDNQ